MPDFSARPDATMLSAGLAEACKRLAALDLPGPLAARLHQQFIAICNAVKAAGADQATCEAKLAAFVSALDLAATKFPGYRNSGESS
jgi:hypothetical protein